MSSECNTSIFSNEILKEILFSVQNAVIVTDPKGIILESNAKVRDLFGYTSEGLNGKELSMLFTPEDQDYLYHNLLYLADQCEVYEDEIMLLRRNKARFFADVRLTSCRNEDNSLNFFSIIDIDKAKKMEKVFNQINYEDLVKLANGVAHEIRNPLVGIGGFLRKLYKSCVASVEDEEYYNHIHSNLKKIEGIVEKVEFFAGMPDPVLKKVRIQDIVDKVILEFQDRINNTECKIDIDVKPFELMADPIFLNRAMKILLENSLDACEKKPEITIRAFTEDNKCKILVKDNGRGISSDVLPYIFHPFFSTKTDGAGIDLSILKRIVENHQGRISVDSQKGKGTSFDIEIPMERRKKIRTNLLKNN